MARLELVETIQEENDDLANYENYIRSQYRALSNDDPINTTIAAPSSTPRGYAQNGMSDRRSSVLFAGGGAIGSRSSITRQKRTPRAAQKKRK